MKTIDQIKVVGGSTGAITLVAILASIHEQLVTVGPWVLDTMIACAGSAILYGGFRVYVAGRHHWLLMRAKENEIKDQEQARQIEAERWQVERARLVLDQQMLVSRIYPDSKGFMPTIVNMVPEGGYQYVSLPHPAHQARIAGAAQQAALPEHAESKQEDEIEDEQDNVPPIRYEEIRHLIPRGQSCLGVDPFSSKVETCDFAALMTMWICGGSSTGKTNTVSLKINEAIENGRNLRLIVIDPHKEKSDSLYNKIRRYERYFLFQVASTSDEIYNALSWFKAEFERRLQAGNESQNDILLIVDEVPRVVKSGKDNADLVKEIAEVCGTESRGFGMFGWFISQRAAGLAWLRNVVITVIAHKMIMMSERKLAANDITAIARDMDHWPRGRVVVYGAEFEPKVLQMPLFTPSAVVESTATVEPMEELQPKKPFPNSSIVDFQTEQLRRAQMASETAQETGGKNTDELTVENAAVLKNLLSVIREKRANGTPLNTILREYGVNGGRAHQEVKQLIEEMDA